MCVLIIIMHSVQYPMFECALHASIAKGQSSHHYGQTCNHETTAHLRRPSMLSSRAAEYANYSRHDNADKVASNKLQVTFYSNARATLNAIKPAFCATRLLAQSRAWGGWSISLKVYQYHTAQIRERGVFLSDWSDIMRNKVMILFNGFSPVLSSPSA